MTGMVLLDVCIGVLFVILVFSIVASAMTEAAAGIFQWRAHGLMLGVARLLGPAFEEFWEQPLIDSLRGPKARLSDLIFWRPPTHPKTREEKRDPSYLPPDTFAKELLVYTGLDGKTPEEIVELLRERAEKRKSNAPTSRPPDRGSVPETIAERLEAVEDRLLRVLTNVKGDVAVAEKTIAEWFDTSMQRVSGWYVRRTKLVLFLIGLLLAALLNINLFGYAKALIDDDQLRAKVVAAAETAAAAKTLESYRRTLGFRSPIVEDEPIPEPPKEQDAEAKVEDPPAAIDLAAEARKMQDVLTRGRGALDQTGVAMGWSKGAFSLGSIPSWILLAFAITLGAQFWFDLLKTFVQVRAAGIGLSGKNSAAITSDPNAQPPEPAKPPVQESTPASSKGRKPR